MLQKLASHFKELGVGPGTLYLVDRCLTRISPKLRLLCYDLMVQPVPNRPQFPVRLTKSFECREIKRGDPNLNHMQPPPEIIEFRFNQNAICLGLFKKEKLMGYIWFNFGKYKEDEARCLFLLEPESESVFDFDIYIFPEHRLGLGFIALWEKANSYLYECGIRQTFSRLAQSNIASKKAHKHLGAKRLGQVFFLKIGFFEFMMATIPPYLGFSFRESGRIKVKLTADALKNTPSIS